MTRTVSVANSQRPHWAERLRAFLFVLVPSALALAFLWVLVFSVQQIVARERLVALAEVEAESTRERLQEVLAGYSALAVIAAQHAHFSVLETADERALPAIRDMFVILAAESPDIMQVRLIGADGRERVRVDRDGAMIDVIPASALQDKSARDYVIATRALPLRGVYMSAVDLNVERRAVEVPWKPTIRIATPIDQDGNLFVINFSARYLLSLFRDNDLDGIRTQLLDDNGFWLAGMPDEDLWGSQLNPEASLALRDPGIWQQMKASEHGVVQHDGTVYAFLHVDAEDTAGQRIARPHAVHAATGWYVVALVTPELVASVAPWLHPGILFIALMLVALGSWFWSGAIVGRRRAVAAEADAQVRLMRAEKASGIASMVAGVAHELNTPIGNAVMVVSTLSEQVDGFERDAASGALRRSTMERFVADLREGLGVMRRGLGEAARLIGNFKEVAVDQVSEKRREFELDAYMQELAATMATRFRHAHVALDLELSSGARMQSYPGALGQVVMNLANNALDHGFRDRTDGRVTLWAQAKGPDEVVIAVEDNGAGILPDLMSRIFDPFFTTRMGQGGSGLGLSIVRNIVEQILGGTVEVTSDPGKQTRFIIVLPVNAPERSGQQEGERP